MKITVRGQVLVLEDCPGRIEWFSLHLPRALICTSAHQALAALNKETFDTIFLDYDLGVGRPSGCIVAARLVAMNFAGKIFVHSVNPIGQKKLLWHLASLNVRKATFREFEIESGHKTERKYTK